MVPAVEVFVYGLVELSAACEAFASCDFRIQSEEYHGKVVLEVPGRRFNFVVTTSVHYTT